MDLGANIMQDPTGAAAGVSLRLGRGMGSSEEVALGCCVCSHFKLGDLQPMLFL